MFEMYISRPTCLFLWLVPNVLVLVESLSCTFESGFCEWLQRHNDQFDWKLGSGYTTDPTSGPRYDHTTGSGQYIYITGKDSYNATSMAVLQSPLLYVTKNMAMTFWYHMNGVGVGKLSILKIDKYGRQVEVWAKHGRQGPEWKSATVFFDMLTVQIKFVASASLHYSSDIAVDDISVNFEPFENTAAPTMPTTTKPTEIPLGCNFDANLCLWNQVTTDQIDWHRIKGHSQDFSSGLYSDHTSGNGSYISLFGHEARNSSWSAILASPMVTFNTDTRMLFWYHMNGIGTGQLLVHQQAKSGSDAIIWSRSGQQNSKWIMGEVQLYSGTYKIMFEASAKYHYASDIGVDDISFDFNPVASEMTAVNILG